HVGRAASVLADVPPAERGGGADRGRGQVDLVGAGDGDGGSARAAGQAVEVLGVQPAAVQDRLGTGGGPVQQADPGGHGGGGNQAAPRGASRRRTASVLVQHVLNPSRKSPSASRGPRTRGSQPSRVP